MGVGYDTKSHLKIWECCCPSRYYLVVLVRRSHLWIKKICLKFICIRMIFKQIVLIQRWSPLTGPIDIFKNLVSILIFIPLRIMRFKEISLTINSVDTDDTNWIHYSSTNDENILIIMIGDKLGLFVGQGIK